MLQKIQVFWVVMLCCAVPCHHIVVALDLLGTAVITPHHLIHRVGVIGDASKAQ